MALKKVNLLGNHFDGFIKAQKDLEDQIKNHGEKAVKAWLKDWFEKHPDIYGLKWMQYTPFFNDGEECVFGIHGLYSFTTKEDFESDEDPYNNGVDMYGEGLFDALEEIETILKSALGDHSIVKATRKKIEVEEYDHE